MTDFASAPTDRTTSPVTVVASWDQLVERACRLVATGGRHILGITGAPGAGESRLCAALLEALGVDAVVYHIFRREITMKGSFAEISSFPATIEALRSGRARTDGLVTHRFTIEDYAAALEALRSDRTAHKVVITA